MTWGIVGSVAATVIGGAISSDSNRKAIHAQQDATSSANALQKYMYDTSRADNQPWMQAGQDALTRLTGLLNDGSLSSKFAGTNVQNEPGYAFGMQQGQKAIDNSASARGGIGGAALMAGSKFAQDYAGTKYNDAFNRFQTERNNMLDPLYRIAGFGMAGNQQVGAAGNNYANQVGNNITSLGNAQAANALNQGNIYGNALNQGIAAWTRQPTSGASFGRPLNSFFGGVGGSGD